MHLPASLATIFNGTDLGVKTGVSAIVATVDELGSPHLSFLSVGEVLIIGDRLALTLWSKARTAGALQAQRRGVFFAAAGGGVSEIGIAVEDIRPSPDASTTIFLGRLNGGREHRAPYADVSSMVGFTLHDPAHAQQRWHLQIDAMRRALGPQG